MAYLKPFARVTFGGTLADDQEIWSCSFHIGTAGGPWSQDHFDAIASTLSSIGAAIVDFVSDEATLVPQGVKLNYVNLSQVGTDGKTIGETVGIPLSGQGSAVGAYVPQAALVNTFMSDKYKDPGKYNRFYLPVTNAGFQGSFQLPGSAQTAYSVRSAQFVADVNAALDAIGPEVTASWDVVSNAGSGSQLAVTAVKLGRVIDTQRRRRNSLSEAYSVTGVPATPTP